MASWSRPEAWKGRTMEPGTRVRIRSDAKEIDQDTGEEITHYFAGIEATVVHDFGSITQAGFDVMIRLNISLARFAEICGVSELTVRGGWMMDRPEIEVNLAEHLELI